MLRVRSAIRSFSSSARMASNISLQNLAVTRLTPPIPMEVHLNDNESRLCLLLNQCTDYLREHKNVNTTCRIAGGWVRDKLLGHESNDIDIALSDMMGATFAEHLSEFAAQQEITTGTIAKIATNPDQSKHLETATFKLFNLELDLVNLRSEEYAADSRIPTGVTFGTPLEDALRRDITINALFYNVQTQEVEDHTEKGLQDLRDGLVRTPLPPRETFKDDPLRVLRCVRFASRYGFELVPELSEAAKDKEIQSALVSKVSRERVGVELTKMINGRDPLRSIRILEKLSLFDSIVTALPQDVSKALSNQPAKSDFGLQISSVLNLLLNPSDSGIINLHPYFLKPLHTDPTTTSRLYLASFLAPYMTITYKDRKGKTRQAVEAVIRESLKLGTQNHFVDGVPFLYTALPKVRELLDLYSTFPVERVRSSIGTYLRHKTIHHLNSGVHWSTAFLFSLVVEVGQLYNVSADSLDVGRANALIEEYNRFATVVEGLGLYEVGEMRPLLDGREVTEALGAKKGGPWLADALAMVVEWQLDQPDATKRDCLEWIKAEREQGRMQVHETPDHVSKKPRRK